MMVYQLWCTGDSCLCVGDPMFKSLALGYAVVTTVFHNFCQSL